MAQLKVPVSEKDHVQGDPAAAVTLVEYGDFQCPDAGMAYSMVKKLQRHYGKKLRFVYRNFPLIDIHPMAEPAAEAAEFAGTQGKFWEMHDALFENQDRLSDGMLAKVAERLGMDGEAASEAIENQQFEEQITHDVDGGAKSGVHGTPTFFVNGKLYEGEWEFEDLRAAIDEAM